MYTPNLIQLMDELESAIRAGDQPRLTRAINAMPDRVAAERYATDFADAAGVELVYCDDCGGVSFLSQSHTTHDGQIVCHSCCMSEYWECDGCGELFRRYSDEWLGGAGGYCASCYDAMDVVDDDDGSDDDDAGPVREYGTDVLDVIPVDLRPGVRYFGVELEVECADRYAAASIILSCAGGQVICKYDGSLTEHGNKLGDGVEIVTVPLTLETWQGKKRNELYNFLRDPWATQGLRSHDSDVCGLHIHVSRGTVAEATIAKVNVFLNDNRNAEFLSALARRDVAGQYYCAQAEKKLLNGHTEWVPVDLTPELDAVVAKHVVSYHPQLAPVLEADPAAWRKYYVGGYSGEGASCTGTTHWSFVAAVKDAVEEVLGTRDTYADLPILPEYGFGAGGLYCRLAADMRPYDLPLVQVRQQQGKRQCNQHGRYTPLNLDNSKTIEFRIFRGSLKRETIQRSVEFCDAVLAWAQHTPVRDLVVEKFVAWCGKHATRKVYPELRAWLERKEYLPRRARTNDQPTALTALAA